MVKEPVLWERPLRMHLNVHFSQDSGHTFNQAYSIDYQYKQLVDKKMIAVFYNGRLGNQMLQYAFARQLRAVRGERDKLLFNFYLVHCNGPREKGFEDGLQYFKVLPYLTASNLGMLWRAGNMSQKLSYAAYRLLHLEDTDALEKIFNRRGIFLSCDTIREFPQEIRSYFLTHKDIYLSGLFDNPSLFSGIRPLLLKEFVPVRPVIKSNEVLMQQILHSQSVCVHIRRDDYLSENLKKNFHVCDKAYYQKAIQLMKERLSKPTFVFFSDDIAWVRATLHPDAPCLYEPVGNPAWETLRLMYSCKHFIISNSTFSWWAQYLGREKNKIVISPDRWFNNPDWHQYLLQEDFIKIH